MKKFTARLLLLYSLIILLTSIALVACGQDATPTTSTTGQAIATPGAPTVATTPTPTLAPLAVRATQTVALAQTVAGTVVPVTSGAGSSSGPTVTSGPTGGVTMKEAYALVAPLISNWASDAVLTDVSVDPDDLVGLLPDGRCGSWFFTAVSVSLNRQDNWQVKAVAGSKPAAAQTVEGDLDAETLATQAASGLPPVSSLIDTNRMMEIARQNGGDKSQVPVGFDLHKPSKETDPLAFNLVFQNGSQVTTLRIDAQNGQLLQNVKG